MLSIVSALLVKKPASSRSIEAWNLVVDPVVRDFYAHLDDQDYRPLPTVEADAFAQEPPAPVEPPVAQEPPAPVEPPVEPAAQMIESPPAMEQTEPQEEAPVTASMRIPNELSESLKNAIGRLYPRPGEGVNIGRLLACLKDLFDG